MAGLPHRFDVDEHTYTVLESGEELPHITQMLADCGWLPSAEFYSDESAERGTAVHALTASYDLGALDLPACVSRYRPYLLGHALAMSIMQPEILAVEQSIVHPAHRFGGRPDRVWRLDRVLTVVDEKSGGKEKAYRIQTALQAILVSIEHDNITPEMIARAALYLTPKGKFVYDPHTDRRDFDEARKIIHRCCR